MFTLTGSEINEQAGVAVHNYEGTFTVALAGDSIWSDTTGKTVTVTGATVVKEDGECLVYVAHDSTWDIYADTGFEAAISKALGFDVGFTEQGMQEDGNASLETV